MKVKYPIIFLNKIVCVCVWGGKISRLLLMQPNEPETPTQSIVILSNDINVYLVI